MTSLIPWLVIGTVGAIFVALGALLWARLNGYRRWPARDSAASSEFMPTRYDPMARLLRDEDVEFLRQFTNCRPKLAARWERERKQIFRLYLRQAAADFRRLHAEARLRLVNAPEEQAHAVKLLMRLQLTFWRTLTMIELRLVLNSLAFGKIGALDAGKLVGLIDAMKAEVQRSAVPASA